MPETFRLPLCAGSRAPAAFRLLPSRKLEPAKDLIRVALAARNQINALAGVEVETDHRVALSLGEAESTLCRRFVDIVRAFWREV